MIISGLKKLYQYRGYRLNEVSFSENIVHVNLEFDKRCKDTCPHCGRKGFIEDVEAREARDMPSGPARLVYIRYPARKFRCNACGTRSWLTPDEIDSKRGVTKRMMVMASRLMCDMPIKKVAAFINGSETTLRRWDKAVLKEHLGEVCLDNLSILLVDEKSIGKRHHYITTVLNGETGDLLHCCEGKKKESLKSFFDLLNPEQKASIQVVCIDRGGAYLECVKEELPLADIAFDKYHLVSNLNDVIDDLRREEWNRLCDAGDEQGKALLKGQRYNLLRREEKNTGWQQRRLDELLAMNQTLSTAYVLTEDFRDALSQNYICHAKRALEIWVETAVNSGIGKIVAFARKMEKASEGIINAIRYKVSNGMLEGFNNLISRIIHRGNGYKDMDYLKLKLRQASLPECFKVP